MPIVGFVRLDTTWQRTANQLPNSELVNRMLRDERHVVPWVFRLVFVTLGDAFKTKHRVIGVGLEGALSKHLQREALGFVDGGIDPMYTT